MLTTVAVFLAALFMTISIGSGTVRKVPQEYSKIQLAIDAAVNGDTILVAEGLYLENILISKKIVLGSLYLIDNDTSHISKTILDGGSPANTDSGSVIHITAGTDSTTVISGFTIQNGNGMRIYDGSYWRGGGGISIFAGGARITHNIISHNNISTSDGVFGGGISIASNSGSLAYWIIEENQIAQNSINTSAGAEGGGAWLSGDGRLVHNIVENNNSTGSSYGRSGGIYVGVPPGNGSTNIQFHSNIIRGNYASFRVGGLGLFGSTAVVINASFVNNLITDNTALSNTGGMLIAGRGNVSLVNNMITRNSSGASGGGLLITGGGIVSLVNNTIVDNSASGFGTGIFVDGIFAPNTTVIGINNIFWNNDPEHVEIFGADFESFHNNLIRGESSIGDNNFSADPMFSADSSYSLTTTSPCIAAGTSSREIFGITITAPSTDLTGGKRPRPSGTSPDIGALESDFSATTAQRPNRAEVRKFDIGGVVGRHHVVIKPKGHELELNRPVLIHLTGYGDPLDYEMNYIRIHKYADSVGFVTVYPEAYTRRWNSTMTEITGDPTATVDDVQYISTLIDTLRAQYSIDPNRVYITGFSNGGVMANLLATKIPRRITAVCVVAGSISPTIINGYSPNRPVPIMILNGTADPIVPYYGGGNWFSVEHTVGIWRTWYNATVRTDSAVIDGNSTDQSSVLRVRYYGNSVDTPLVVFYKINNGGHEWPGAAPYVWPGSGIINRDIDVNTEAIKFFVSSKPLGVNQQKNNNSLPIVFELSQNFPNPFNPSTTIRYALPSSAHVNLTIHDILGREITTLVNEKQSAGWKEVEWNARNVSSGMYFYKLTANNPSTHSGKVSTETKKCLIVK